MSLVKAITRQLTTRHISSSGDTALATSGMSASASALIHVQKGGKLAAKAVKDASLVGAGPMTQQRAQSVMTSLGRSEQEAAFFIRMEPLVKKAVNQIAKGEKARIGMMQEVGKVGVGMAVLNAETQAAMAGVHATGQAQLTYAQARYGGGGLAL